MKCACIERTVGDQATARTAREAADAIKPCALHAAWADLEAEPLREALRRARRSLIAMGWKEPDIDILFGLNEDA